MKSFENPSDFVNTIKNSTVFKCINTNTYDPPYNVDNTYVLKNVHSYNTLCVIPF